MDEDDSNYAFGARTTLLPKNSLASIGDIFDYEDAIKALVVTDTEIVNDSSLTLYLKLDGERVTIAPKSTCKI